MTISLTDSLPPLASTPVTVKAKTEQEVLLSTVLAGALVSPPVTPPSSVTSPSTIVTLNATEANADTYSQPMVDVIQTRNQYKESPAAAKMSNQLISSLGSIRANTSPFSVAALFSQVGNISRETTSYRNEARSMAVAGNKLSDDMKVDFSKYKGGVDEWVNLTIRTKDGDDIAVTVSRFRNNAGRGDTLEFTFDVTGELSEAEQDALDKLAAKLGGVADDFFRSGTAELNGLKEFDKANLESFHFEFSRHRGEKKPITMSFDYKYDQEAQTQQLTASDAVGYKIDIKTNLAGLLVKGGASAHDALQQYLHLISKSLSEHGASSASRRFIMDGFANLVTPESSAAAAKPEQTKAEKIVDAFASGLADFKASIQAPLNHTRKNYLYPEAMNLQLEQSTRVEEAKERTLIRQTSSYELNSSRIRGRAGSEEASVIDEGIESGNFNYKTIHMKEQTTRLLDMTDDKINNAYSEHESSLDIQEKKFGNFHLEETQEEHKQDQVLTQLQDVIAAKKLQKESMDALKELAEDKKSLFTL